MQNLLITSPSFHEDTFSAKALMLSIAYINYSSATLSFIVTAFLAHSVVA